MALWQEHRRHWDGAKTMHVQITGIPENLHHGTTANLTCVPRFFTNQ